MADDPADKYLEMCERDIAENEREIKKMEPDLPPLQEAVRLAFKNMETAEQFHESCKRDFNDACAARERVTARIDHRKRILKRDNDLLNAALRRRREDEKKAARRAAREAKRKERENG